VPLDADEFLALEVGLNEISVDRENIREAFDALPMDGRSYKFVNFNSACPDLEDFDSEPSPSLEMACRRALMPLFGKPVGYGYAMAKTFFPGGKAHFFKMCSY